MSTLLAVVWLQVSVPYQDVNRRFTLDLPGGWEAGPVAAGAEGASFRCSMQGSVALAAVRVVTGAAGNPAQLLRQIDEPMTKEPGYRLVEEGAADLAGLAAARRRYSLFVDGNPAMVKLAEDRLAVAQGTAYLIHVEALRGAFPTFSADFDHLFKSFRLGEERAVVDGPSPAVVGRWRMQDTTDTFLELRNDGTFDLAGTPGTFRVQGGNLLMWPGQGGMESFTWKRDGADLVLNSPSLGSPMRYHRAAGAAEAALVGRWSSGKRMLEFGADGTAKLDGKSYTFSVEGDRLTFLSGKKRAGMVVFALQGEELTVSGWKLGKSLTLRRQ